MGPVRKNLKKVIVKLRFILPTVALFLSSLLFLLLGSDGLNYLDHSLISTHPILAGNVALAEVAGVTQARPKAISANLSPPQFSAWAVLVKDIDSGQILYQKDIDTPYAPASTTKLMSALVAQEHFNAGDILSVPNLALVGGSTMGLKVGETLTFRSLLYGMLLDSGNDAAYTIASNYPGGITAFVAAMNRKAAELGLKNSHFENPAGFDNVNHYSSAADLAVIAEAVAGDYQLSKIVSTKQTEVFSFDSSREHILKNLNRLLEMPGVIGMKTGTTEKAGENLVGLVERDNHKIITVMLGSKDRFKETERLIDWVFKNYSWR